MTSPEAPIAFSIDAEKITEVDFRILQNFRKLYYASIFPGARPWEIADFVNESSIASVRDPNKSVGGKRQRKGQAFDRATVTAVIDRPTNDQSPVTESYPNTTGIARSADNVSSHSWALGPFGSLERYIKMHTPIGTKTGSKYRAVHELIGVTEPAIACLLNKVKEESEGLPLVIYSYPGEDMVQQVLTENDMRQNPHFVAPETSYLHVPSLGLALPPIQYIAAD